jgi:hypothetical protein
MYHIYLTCASDHLPVSVHLFEQGEIEQVDLEVLDFGHTRKGQNGYLVLEIEGELDPTLLAYLQNESAILDYVVVSVPCQEDAYPFGTPFPCRAGGRPKPPGGTR